MGHWGCGLEESDSVQDYKYDIEEQLRSGKSIYEMSYWCEHTLLALADWQASTGKVASHIKKAAYEQIDEEIEELDNGTSGWSEPEEREEALFKLQGDLADALETKINVEKKFMEYMLSGQTLNEAYEKLEVEVEEDAKADFLDLARLKMKSGNLDLATKTKALSILHDQLSKLHYRFHLHQAKKTYETLKKEIEKA